MDPQKLLYLAAVIEQGSLKKAAKHLLVSQPALSKSMERLEHEVGVKLLERSAAGITPTVFGEILYSHARLVREEIELAKQRVHKVGTERAPIVTFGTLPSLASTVVSRALGRWRERDHTTVVRVVEKVQVELLLGLVRGDFDFIVAQTECYDFMEGLKQRVLFRDRLRIFARPEHPLFQQPEFSWADLARFPWVCPMVGMRQRTLLERLLASKGLDLPQKLIECGSIDFTKSLVAASDHLALLAAHAVTSDVSEGRIRSLPFTVPALSRDIAVIFRDRAPLDEVSREIVAHIEATGAELSREDSRVSPDAIREAAAT